MAWQDNETCIVSTHSLSTTLLRGGMAEYGQDQDQVDVPSLFPLPTLRPLQISHLSHVPMSMSLSCPAADPHHHHHSFSCQVRPPPHLVCSRQHPSLYTFFAINTLRPPSLFSVSLRPATLVNSPSTSSTLRSSTLWPVACKPPTLASSPSGNSPHSNLTFVLCPGRRRHLQDDLGTIFVFRPGLSGLDLSICFRYALEIVCSCPILPLHRLLTPSKSTRQARDTQISIHYKRCYPRPWCQSRRLVRPRAVDHTFDF